MQAGPAKVDAEDSARPASSRRAVFESTVQRLYEMIFGGELVPGSSVRELDLEATLGVSRSPIREALRRLEEDGLVTSDKRNGWREVVDFRVEDLEELYQIRAELEGLAVQFATSRISVEAIEEAQRLTDSMAPPWPNPRRDFAEDFEFHRTICRACDRRRLVAILDRIWLQNQVMLIQFDKVGAAASLEEIAQVRLEHQVVIAALKARNPAAARAAMSAHILGGATRRAVRAKLV